MNTSLEIIRSDRNMLMPERRSIDDLEEAGDILLLAGLKKMGEIVAEPETQDVAIKAFNSIVGMQRYISTRKRIESIGIDAGLEDDLGDVLG